MGIQDWSLIPPSAVWLTRETTPPKPPPHFVLPVLLPSITRRVARSMNWYQIQSSSQKNAHPRRWKRIPSLQVWLNRIYAYRSEHFGAKTSAWHWGRVSAALMRLLHGIFYFRHAAWGLCGWLLLPFSSINVFCPIRACNHPATRSRSSFVLEEARIWFQFLSGMDGQSIQPALMTAQLPLFKQAKSSLLIDTLLQNPCRKNIEEIIGILLWAPSLVHRVRFLLSMTVLPLLSKILFDFRLRHML